ncbi:MAG: phosphatase PAP2 family protein [Pseudolabrys sp.]
MSIAGVFIQHRVSPVSCFAFLFTLTLAAIALIVSNATKLSFVALPNIMPLVISIVVLDILSQFAPQTRNVRIVQTILYGVLYLVITSFCGVLAAYAMQRLAFPLQDQLLASADAALGVKWFDIAYWVDDHPQIQRILKLAYDSMSSQIALPLVILALSNRLSEVRVYLLAFAIALTITTIVAALMPAASPIALVDRTTFNILRFTGATPLDHLMRLRAAAPMTLSDAFGGIITFPSFHAAVAVLTSLTLRHYHRIFVVLLFLNAALLCGAVTEGAHYVSDILAGGGLGFFAYLLAVRIIRAEDRSLHRRRDQSLSCPHGIWSGD